MYAFRRATPTDTERVAHQRRRIYEGLGFRLSNEMLWRAP